MAGRHPVGSLLLRASALPCFCRPLADASPLLQALRVRWLLAIALFVRIVSAKVVVLASLDLLRPRRPRLDKACADGVRPTSGPHLPASQSLASNTARALPKTGFQYCAVDSITTSSTCCWISHSANRCICCWLLRYPRRSNWYSSSTPTSATTTASFFLCTSIPAIRILSDFHEISRARRALQ
jgi:hypothetical protein